MLWIKSAGISFEKLFLDVQEYPCQWDISIDDYGNSTHKPVAGEGYGQERVPAKVAEISEWWQGAASCMMLERSAQDWRKGRVFGSYSGYMDGFLQRHPDCDNRKLPGQPCRQLQARLRRRA